MRLHIRSSYLTILAALIALPLFAQNPIKWSYAVKDVGNCQVDLIFIGVLEEGWCTYSQFLESEDGPVPTTINFNPGINYKLVGKAAESGEIIKVHDAIFGMNLTKFKHKAILTQRVEISDPSKPITGFVNGMTCNDEMCLPPKDTDFSFKIPTLSACKTAKN
jgi:hypothetical protein